MNEVVSSFGLSFRRACRITGWNRSSLQYLPTGRDDTLLRQRLRDWAVRKPKWGSPILHDLLKSEGLVINHKRTERIYREEGLSLRRKRRRKLPALARVPLPRPDLPNQRWSMDFIHDQLSNGRRFRCLIIVDDFTRQCLALHVDTSIGGAGVVSVLQNLARSRGLPQVITADNGPEFTGKALHVWAQNAGVTLHHIQPGRPMQNGFAESFNGTFRQDCLDLHWFSSIDEARLLIEHWRINDYNQIRPHSSIGRVPPDTFALPFLTSPPNQQPIPINPAAA
jgi:putative transposase